MLPGAGASGGDNHQGSPGGGGEAGDGTGRASGVWRERAARGCGEQLTDALAGACGQDRVCG